MESNRILIIEDEKSISDILTYKLSKEGFNVKNVDTGHEGLNILTNFNPNLILLDIMLPDMSGFDICSEIKSKKDIPIIMLTARNDEIDINRGLEVGANEYITKPFDINELLVKIRKAIPLTN